jgi:hypothetical protein
MRFVDGLKIDQFDAELAEFAEKIKNK